MSVLRLHVGDRVQLRKPHPCGGETWEVLRTGADIRLRCTTCQRMLLQSRARLARRVQKVIPSAGVTDAVDPQRPC